MFPPVKVTFSLDAAEVASASLSQAGGAQGPSGRDKFQVLMDILPYDGKRYRYAYHKSSWQQAGKADPPSPAKLFLHPDGPFTLDQLKRQVISFEKIKLTNNDANKHGYVSTRERKINIRPTMMLISALMSQRYRVLHCLWAPILRASLSQSRLSLAAGATTRARKQTRC